MFKSDPIASAGIQVSRIGQVREPDRGVQAFYQGRPVSWPKFEVDEITKLF